MKLFGTKHLNLKFNAVYTHLADVGVDTNIGEISLSF